MRWWYLIYWGLFSTFPLPCERGWILTSWGGGILKTFACSLQNILMKIQNFNWDSLLVIKSPILWYNKFSKVRATAQGFLQTLVVDKYVALTNTNSVL